MTAGCQCGALKRIVFIREFAMQVFQLVDPKELTPLQELIDTIIR